MILKLVICRIVLIMATGLGFMSLFSLVFVAKFKPILFLLDIRFNKFVEFRCEMFVCRLSVLY